MLTRKRPRLPAFLPAPLPSLSDAFARRAAIVGPFDADEAPTFPGGLSRCAAALRSLADLLDRGAGRSSPQRYQTTAAAGPASRATPTNATMHCSHIGSLALAFSEAVASCSVIASSPRLAAPLQ
jgi:hypothetical protein